MIIKRKISLKPIFRCISSILFIVFISCNNSDDLGIYKKALHFNNNEMYDKTISLILENKIDTPNIFILKELSYAYYFKNEYAKCSKIVSLILKHDSNNVFAFYMKGMLDKEIGNHTSAIANFNKAIMIKGGEFTYIDRKAGMDIYSDAELDIEMVILRFFRGEAEFIIGNHKEAYKDFTFCINNGNDLSNSYYYRSIILWKAGETDKACDDFYNALKYGFKDENNLKDSICPR